MTIQLITNGLMLVSKNQILQGARARTRWNVSSFQLHALLNKALSPTNIKEAYLVTLYDGNGNPYDDQIFLSYDQKWVIKDALQIKQRDIQLPPYDSYTNDALVNLSHSITCNTQLNIPVSDFYFQTGAKQTASDTSAFLDINVNSLRFCEIEFDNINAAIKNL